MFFKEYDLTEQLASALVQAQFSVAADQHAYVILQIARSQIGLLLKGQWPQYCKQVPKYPSRISFPTVICDTRTC